MTLRQFMNALRSLRFVETDKIPNLTQAQRTSFLTDPIAYLIRCDDEQAAAIWAEMAALVAQALGAPALGRKIVQISAIPATSGYPRCVLALCDDGTLWARAHGTQLWERFPDIPQE